MTPLNTIIEEEKKAFDEKFFRDTCGGLIAKHTDEEDTKDQVQILLTTAMQRAYEAGRAEEREEINGLVKEMRTVIATADDWSDNSDVWVRLDTILSKITHKTPHL